MNTQTTSFTLNSSAPVAANSLNLGWNAMPVFTLADEEVTLGWNAMPAFGQAGKGASNAEFVAQFVSETAHIETPSANRPSFWSMIRL
jgi:hypothetical protein